MLRAWLAGCSMLAILIPAAASAAAPATRDAAIDAYKAVLDDERVGAGWTGSVDGCVVGQESQASLDATLRTVNTLRSFAGIGPVTFDETADHRALAAALMMLAANDLSHTPDPSWPCYSDDGSYAARRSNLFLGASGADAMVGYLDDAGINELGHRRWLIDPAALVFGSGSTGGSNSLMVFDLPNQTVPSGTTVAWPPGGFVPWPWVFDDWSIAVGGTSDASSYNTQNAQVRVSLDGEPLDVTKVQTLPDGYGTGRTLSWNVAVPGSAKAGDHDLKVAIDGVTANGADRPLSYTVHAIRPPSPNDAAACATAQAKLEKAKAKLKKLRRNGASKQRVAKAKRKVEDAKAAVAAIC
jgi:uncharacterized protein YkwD